MELTCSDHPIRTESRSISLEVPVSWSLVVTAARAPGTVAIEPSPGRWQRIERSHAHLMRRLREDGLQVYGVTTGFGAGAKKSVSDRSAAELQSNLLSYLDCSLGELASPEISRATLLLRIVSLAQGYSAVSPALLRHLIAIHNAGYCAAIPTQGSLGASGDLIPLASVGQCARGIGQAYAPDGCLVPADRMLRSLGLPPFRFEGKDALGLVNGTALMTAIACFALETFEYVCEWAIHGSAGLFHALRAHPSAFSELVNSRAKRHPGQSHVAERLRRLCAWQDFDFAPRRERGTHDLSLQDSYSIRCTPQVLGPVWEAFEAARDAVEREVNSCNDNPLVDPDTGMLSSGGNFYGGSIALAMDQLAWAGAHVADLLDRQITLAVQEKYSRGLPADLSGAALAAAGQGRPDAEAFDALSHHGLKGLHQHANALTCDIVRLAVPSSIFSRSSESHNQDKISLGTHAARNAAQQLELLARLAAIHSACAAQALELRGEGAPPTLAPWLASVREHVPFVRADVSLRAPLLELVRRISCGGPVMSASGRKRSLV